jgi:ankyrin repeat protein
LNIGSEHPLLLAMQKESMLCLGLLIEYSANANYRGTDASNVLRSAMKSWNIIFVPMILRQGADVNSPSGLWDVTPLEIAAASGNLKMVKMLLEYGADVNVTNTSFSQRPTHFDAIDAAAVAKQNSVEIVQWLLDHGAGYRPKDNTPKHNPLHYAPHNHNAPLLRLLLSRGVGGDVKDRAYELGYASGGTALHFAIQNSSVKHTGIKDLLEILRALLEVEADPDIKMCTGRSKWKANRMYKSAI